MLRDDPRIAMTKSLNPQERKAIEKTGCRIRAGKRSTREN